MMHLQMKTKHWDVEEDLSLDDDSVMRFNFNEGGKGHVCKSEQEIGRDRVMTKKVNFSLSPFQFRAHFCIRGLCHLR